MSRLRVVSIFSHLRKENKRTFPKCQTTPLNNHSILSATMANLARTKGIALTENRKRLFSSKKWSESSTLLEIKDVYIIYEDKENKFSWQKSCG